MINIDTNQTSLFIASPFLAIKFLIVEKYFDKLKKVFV